MSLTISPLRLLCLSSTLAFLVAGCGGAASPEARTAATATADVPSVTATTSLAFERPISRYVAVTGTLAAQEQADVASEIAGRVVSTPVERGTRVTTGSILVQIAETEVRAQADEAGANTAQLEARLGLAGGGAAFEIDRVPEVANARAAADLAQADFDRARMLLDRKLLPQADFDRSRAQADAARRQYDIARNGAEQQYQALVAARARMTMARKALADAVVRAPFDGIVDERLVSVGDYVIRGTKVASVMRTTPLRVELTVPGQYLSSIAIGRSVSLEVDAYPGRTFTGLIRYVSPAVRADSRALIVEAVVPNESGELKPGLFATARIEQATQTPAVLVPAVAIRTDAGVTRVFVVSREGLAEERIVTTGQTVDDQIELTSGIKAGDTVATSNVERLADGVRITREQ
ncbi:MAG: efflux RND transporter periplasmic adaptor subunit [Acidobacteria bacterium]|nr:efflux RND transporter periplasmic adaptor subunit [Acidobacteriota bacterium]